MFLRYGGWETFPAWHASSPNKTRRHQMIPSNERTTSEVTSSVPEGHIRTANIHAPTISDTSFLSPAPAPVQSPPGPTRLNHSRAVLTSPDLSRYDTACYPSVGPRHQRDPVAAARSLRNAVHGRLQFLSNT